MFVKVDTRENSNSGGKKWWADFESKLCPLTPSFQNDRPNRWSYERLSVVDSYLLPHFDDMFIFEIQTKLIKEEEQRERAKRN